MPGARTWGSVLQVAWVGAKGLSNMLVFFNVKKDRQRKSQLAITYLTSVLHDDRVLRDSEVVWNNLMLNIRWGGSEVAEADMAFGEGSLDFQVWVRTWVRAGGLWALQSGLAACSLNGGFVSSLPPNVLASWLVCIHAWVKACSVSEPRVLSSSGVGAVS